MATTLELGLDTFGDVTTGPDGALQPQPVVIRNLIEEGVLADKLGLDFYGVGEHHRADFAVSAPEVVLAAIAARTQRIPLGPAVTVLSSDDPIRVFQRFSTLDAISKGRAEVVLGRGSFTESFPLFGFDLAQYEQLFEEKLDLFAAIVNNDAVTWEGSLRPPLKDQRVYPPIETGRLKSWIGVGGSPESVVRAASYGMPLLLAIIGGDPMRFRPYVDLYQRALTELKKPTLDIGVHSPGYIGESDESVRKELYPYFKRGRDKLGRERGWPPVTESDFVREIEHGSLYAGSPETVAQKIAATVKGLGLSRFQMKYSAGALPHESLMNSITLYATKVAPRVRELLA